jgi:hypothetical protein
MLTYFPPKAATVAFVDLRTLRDSGLLEKIANSTVSEEEDYKVFVAQTAFDYKNDLDSVLVSSAGDTQLALLTGRFDWKSLISYATSHGGNCRAGFCRIPASRPTRLVSFYAVYPNVMALAISSDEWAAGNVKAQARPRPAVGEIPVQPIWMLVPGSALKNVDSLPTGTRQFAKTLDGAEQVLFALGPSQDRFSVSMDVTCKTDQDAAILRSQLEALTALLKKVIESEKQTPNPGDLSGVLTSGVFQRVDRHVVGSWPIERAFLNALGGG